MEADHHFWKENQEDSAFYIHKLVVPRHLKGMGYGRLMVEWILEYSRKIGKDFVRLDSYGDRGYLTSLYSGCGFSPKETLVMPDGIEIIKWEYSLEDEHVRD